MLNKLYDVLSLRTHQATSRHSGRPKSGGSPTCELNVTHIPRLRKRLAATNTDSLELCQRHCAATVSGTSDENKKEHKCTIKPLLQVLSEPYFMQKLHIE
jgi:hypothetical protein